MTDIKAWVDEHRAIHAAATEGPWAIGSWRDRSFQNHMTIEPKVGHRTIGDVTDDHRGNADAIVDAHNVTVPTALSMIEAVLELHKPGGGYWFKRICKQCSHGEDEFMWPCRTVRALEGVIDGE